MEHCSTMRIDVADGIATVVIECDICGTSSFNIDAEHLSQLVTVSTAALREHLAAPHERVHLH